MKRISLHIGLVPAAQRYRNGLRASNEKGNLVCVRNVRNFLVESSSFRGEGIHASDLG